MLANATKKDGAGTNQQLAAAQQQKKREQQQVAHQQKREQQQQQFAALNQNSDPTGDTEISSMPKPGEEGGPPIESLAKKSDDGEVGPLNSNNQVAALNENQGPPNLSKLNSEDGNIGPLNENNQVAALNENQGQANLSKLNSEDGNIGPLNEKNQVAALNENQGPANLSKLNSEDGNIGPLNENNQVAALNENQGPVNLSKLNSEDGNVGPLNENNQVAALNENQGPANLSKLNPDSGNIGPLNSTPDVITASNTGKVDTNVPLSDGGRNQESLLTRNSSDTNIDPSSGYAYGVNSADNSTGISGNNLEVASNSANNTFDTNVPNMARDVAQGGPVDVNSGAAINDQNSILAANSNNDSTVTGPTYDTATGQPLTDGTSNLVARDSASTNIGGDPNVIAPAVSNVSDMNTTSMPVNQVADTGNITGQPVSNYDSTSGAQLAPDGSTNMVARDTSFTNTGNDPNVIAPNVTGHPGVNEVASNQYVDPGNVTNTAAANYDSGSGAPIVDGNANMVARDTSYANTGSDPNVIAPQVSGDPGVNNIAGNQYVDPGSVTNTAAANYDSGSGAPIVDGNANMVARDTSYANTGSDPNVIAPQVNASSDPGINVASNQYTSTPDVSGTPAANYDSSSGAPIADNNANLVARDTSYTNTGSDPNVITPTGSSGPVNTGSGGFTSGDPAVNVASSQPVDTGSQYTDTGYVNNAADSSQPNYDTASGAPVVDNSANMVARDTSYSNTGSDPNVITPTGSSGNVNAGSSAYTGDPGMNQVANNNIAPETRVDSSAPSMEQQQPGAGYGGEQYARSSSSIDQPVSNDSAPNMIASAGPASATGSRPIEPSYQAPPAGESRPMDSGYTNEARAPEASYASQPEQIQGDPGYNQAGDNYAREASPPVAPYGGGHAPQQSAEPVSHGGGHVPHHQGDVAPQDHGGMSHDSYVEQPPESDYGMHRDAPEYEVDHDHHHHSHESADYDANRAHDARYQAEADAQRIREQAQYRRQTQQGRGPGFIPVPYGGQRQRSSAPKTDSIFNKKTGPTKKTKAKEGLGSKLKKKMTDESQPNVIEEETTSDDTPKKVDHITPQESMIVRKKKSSKNRLRSALGDANSPPPTDENEEDKDE